MNKKWESKAREVYREGMKLFREGVHGLEIMAGKTLEVGRIRLANQQAVGRIRGLFTDLGQRVFDSFMQASQHSSFKNTPDIQNFVEQIRKLQHFVESNIRKLKHLSAVEGVQRATTSSRRATIKKVKKSQKSASRKPAPLKKRSKAKSKK